LLTSAFGFREKTLEFSTVSCTLSVPGQGEVVEGGAVGRLGWAGEMAWVVVDEGLGDIWWLRCV